MNTFVNGEAGELVFSLRFGEGVIEQIFHETIYPIRVQFQKHGTQDFTANGNFFVNDLIPDLYWGKPEIIAPKRKIMIKKEFDVWVNYNKNMKLNIFMDPNPAHIGKWSEQKTVAGKLTFEIEE